jgi:hypothetical protein
MALTYRTESGTEESGSSTTVAVTQTSVVAGSLKIAWVKHEGGTGSITLSDGTSAFTGDTYQGHSNTDLGGQFFYLLSSVASGSVTYTATFNSARTFRSIMVWEYTYSGTASFDTSNRAQSSSSAAVASGNITTTGTDEVVIGSYGEYSARTISSAQINGVAADHTHQFTTINFTASWDRVVSSTFTGEATGTITGAEAWLGHIIAIKVTAGGGGGTTITGLGRRLQGFIYSQGG